MNRRSRKGFALKIPTWGCRLLFLSGYRSGFWFFAGHLLTLLALLVSLLHGHQCGEVRLIVGQDQWGAVTAARGHLEGQIEPSKRDGSKRWNSDREPYLVSLYRLNCCTTEERVDMRSSLPSPPESLSIVSATTTIGLRSTWASTNTWNSSRLS